MIGFFIVPIFFVNCDENITFHSDPYKSYKLSRGFLQE
jgi:hypothetical protein